MRKSFSFFLVILFLSCFDTTSHADVTISATKPEAASSRTMPPPPLAGVKASPVNQSNKMQARTKQTFAVEDKTKTASMPRDQAQQLRADNLEIQVFAEQANKHIADLNKRIKEVLDTYGTTFDNIDLETGAIRRPPSAAVPPKPVKK